MNATAAVKAPSESQVTYINDLLGKIAEYAPNMAEIQRRIVREAYVKRVLTGGVGGGASKAIDTLNDFLSEYKSGRTAPEADAPIWNKLGGEKKVEARPAVPEGRYAVDTDEGHLGFYRVTVSDKGHFTVKVYASDALHALPSWKAQLGVLKKIEAFGVQAAAVQFGKESERCYECGRRLTDSVSRGLGIGPVCRGEQ